MTGKDPFPISSSGKRNIWILCLVARKNLERAAQKTRKKETFRQ